MVHETITDSSGGDRPDGRETRASGSQGFSRRHVLESVSAGSIAALAGCNGGGKADTSKTTSGGDDSMFDAFYTLNPPNDLYFNPFGPVAAGMGLYHWSMLFTGIGAYDRLNPERATMCIYADHLRHTDPIENGTATITIRKDLHWHDGDNYTAHDFATGRKMQLYIAKSTGGEEAIPYKNVRVVDDHTLKLDMRDPSTPHKPWWDAMYGTNLHHSCCTISNGPMWVKHSEWKDWLKKYENADSQDKMKSITQKLKNLHRPFEDTIGYGPWKIKKISGQTVVYEPWEKWPGLIAINWPDVESGTRVGGDVHQTWLENDMTAGLTFYPKQSVEGQAALSGKLDYARLKAESQGKSLGEQGWKKLPRAGRVYAGNTTVGYRVNFASKPLSKTKVRQALLELMPQKKLAVIGYRNTQETSQQSPVPMSAPTGMCWGNVKKWLDTKQISDNWSSYTVDKSDTDKASQLLQDTGLSKQGGNWHTETGEQFTIKMVQSNETPVQVSRAFKSLLSSFGIKTDMHVIEGTQVNQALANGDFDLFYDFDEGGMQWPGTGYQQGFSYTDQHYPWGSSSSVNVNHPDSWEVPSKIGDPSSSTESVDVVPLIRSLNKKGNDFESVVRKLAWTFNQTVPSLVYANGEYKPKEKDRRMVGQLYNDKKWDAVGGNENYGVKVLGQGGNPGYPQTRHAFGAFKPRRK